MNFLNIEQNKICFQYFIFSSFYAISNNKKKIRGGGGGGLEKHFFFISRFMLFSTLNFVLKFWKVPLHLLVKWEVVSPNDR